MPAPHRVAAVLLVAVAASGGVAAASSTVISPPGFQPKDQAAARKIALQHQAVELINRADAHIYAKVPGCRPTFPRPETTVTHDAPSAAVLAVLAPLRRPATPADALPAGSHEVAGFGGETYLDYIRSVTAANGTPLRIVIARSVRPSFRPSARCLDAEHARLVHLLAGAPKALRSTTLDEFAELRHGQEQNAKQPATPQDGIYLFGRSGGGGGASVAQFLQRGVFGSIGGLRQGATSTLNGLVPDGVATVTLEYARTRSRGPYYKPAVFPSAFRRTVRVQDNVLSVHIPRGGGDAFPDRMVWRDAAGTVVHTFTDRDR